MITRTFETDRPVFYISDQQEFSPAIVDMETSVHAVSDTTVSLTYSIITDDMENTVYIYLDEEYTPDESMEFVGEARINLPSGVLEVIDSDLELILDQTFDSDAVSIGIYVNKDHEFMPENFVLVINTESVLDDS